MNMEQVQARIDEVRWYHEIDFGNTLRSVSSSPPDQAAFHRQLWRFIEEQLDAIDFRGKLVLDIGCWDGYWSFYAERRGAAAVMALDDFTQNWSDSKGIYLAKELLRSNVEVVPDCSIYDLSSLDRRFDIVLCLGLYYHLWDPFFGFTQVRHCCKEGATVVVEGNITSSLPPNSLYLTSSFSTSRFTPTRGALNEMLLATYLRPTGIAGLLPFAAVEDPALWGRLPPDSNRVVVTCEAIDEPNHIHLYKPPFGLHVYDPRFRTTAD